MSSQESKPAGQKSESLKQGIAYRHLLIKLRASHHEFRNRLADKHNRSARILRVHVLRLSLPSRGGSLFGQCRRGYSLFPFDYSIFQCQASHDALKLGHFNKMDTGFYRRRDSGLLGRHAILWLVLRLCSKSFLHPATNLRCQIGRKHSLHIGGLLRFRLRK